MLSERLSTRLGLTLPSPLQPFTPNWPGASDVTMWIKRDDLIHPIISGNKWRKLSTFLAKYEGQLTHLVSFGGGYSNHLHALGYCCKQLGIRFTAIIRGNYSKAPSPMINDLIAWQTTIHYVSKIEYRRRDEPDYLKNLLQRYPDAVIVPEGGSQQLALAGIGDMLKECPQPFDTLITPVASGATMAGMVAGVNPGQQVLGIAVLKGVGYLESLVSQFLSDESKTHWQILHEFQHGGYARTTPELLNLCQEMAQHYDIPVEPVYSGKVFFALKTLLNQSYFPKGQNIIIVHTGGLQGARIDPRDNLQR